MPSKSTPQVVVVGAGFCGAALAYHLARADVRVTLVDRRGEFGPGLAYRTGDPRHLLNTPAGRMSALADDPDHFVRWARARDPDVTGGSFLPRGVYGDYLRELVRAGGERVTCLSGHVLDAIPPGPRRPAALALAGGARLAADHVVLATGNLPPQLPAGLDRSLRDDPRYVHDPWSAPGPPLPPDAAVLVLGTGLSALDLALGLDGAGHRGPLHLLSRHGLLPHAHRDPARPPQPRPPAVETWPPSARGALHALRATIRAEAARGGDWRDVIADLRPVSQAIWRRWPASERDRFVRHLRVYWEIHRHRAAPATAAAIAALRASGRLRARAGRIEDMSCGTDAIRLTIRPRGGGPREHLRVDAVLNATGPASDPRAAGDPLLLALARQGLLVPHPLGAEIDDDGAVLDAQGRPSTWLHAVGPLRRPQLWETTAVLELAPQCQSLARRLASPA